MEIEHILTLAASGGLVSLALEHFPFLSPKFHALEPKHKQLVNMGLVLAVVTIVYGGSCLSWNDYFTCDAGGAIEILKVFMGVLLAQQWFHRNVNKVG